MSRVSWFGCIARERDHTGAVEPRRQRAKIEVLLYPFTAPKVSPRTTYF
jgi:hypothetical protein